MNARLTSLWPWLRMLIVVGAVWGGIVCARCAAEAYDAAAAARYAPVCQGEPAADCAMKVKGSVVDKATSVSCTRDSNGVENCTTSYKLRLHYTDRTEWHFVDRSMYNAAHRGDRAEVRTWHGTVVRLTVRGHVQKYEVAADQLMRVWLFAAWLALGLAVWAGVGGRPGTLVAVPNLAGLGLALPFSSMVHGALLGAGLVEWILAVCVAGFCLFWLVGGLLLIMEEARRSGGR